MAKKKNWNYIYQVDIEEKDDLLSSEYYETLKIANKNARRDLKKGQRAIIMKVDRKTGGLLDLSSGKKEIIIKK